MSYDFVTVGHKLKKLGVSWLHAKNDESAGHVIKCQVSWSRDKMSMELAACQKW